MTDKVKILTVYGTRPELIKLASLLSHLKSVETVTSILCGSGQHESMVEQVSDLFQLKADYQLGVMRPNQSLDALTALLLEKLSKLYDDVQPDCVVVQGDTTTAFVAALAAFYKKIPVAHVEAGIRTGQLTSPWPEEGNRKFIATIASWHFAPTAVAAANLAKENIHPDTIFMSGNTVVDAVEMIQERLRSSQELTKKLECRFDFIDRDKKLILVTLHRREIHGEKLTALCYGLKEIASQPGVHLVFPMHLNPNVRDKVKGILGALNNVTLLEPVDYLSFLYLMTRAYLLISDSGGVQEEAATLGTPLLVTREFTDRPESVQAGVAKLVGCCPKTLLEETTSLLNNPGQYQKMRQASAVFGDGQAHKRIADVLMRSLQPNATRGVADVVT